MKFAIKKKSTFSEALERDIYGYLKANNLSRYGGTLLIPKLILFLGLHIIFYAAIFISPPGALQMLFYILLILNSVLLFFNFVHDASHQILFKKRRWNRAFQLLGDFIGVNTYMWHIRHDLQHHTYTNILGGDLIIESIPLLRINPHQPHRSFHRYQRYYAPVLYTLYSLYWILFLDFRLFFKQDICTLKSIKHPFSEWFILFFFKGLYLLYMLVIPVYFLEQSFFEILGYFIIGHLFAGVLISIVAAYGHYMEGIAFTKLAADQEIPSTWQEHELAVTTDFGNKSYLLTWLIGGLNHHICHHMFPGICHVHYQQLTPIIRLHCETAGKPFHEFSLAQAFISHRNFLRKLGSRI